MVLMNRRRLAMQTEMNTEMRELTDNELDAVTGGSIVHMDPRSPV